MFPVNPVIYAFNWRIRHFCHPTRNIFLQCFNIEKKILPGLIFKKGFETEEPIRASFAINYVDLWRYLFDKTALEYGRDRPGEGPATASGIWKLHYIFCGLGV